MFMYRVFCSMLRDVLILKRILGRLKVCYADMSVTKVTTNVEAIILYLNLAMVKW